jgi:hypothetical protein
MEVGGQLHVLATLAWGKEPPVPLNKRMGGPQIQSGYFKLKKSFLLGPEISQFLKCSSVTD